MSIIYEPKGAAREYAALACNLYHGCTHGCRYCYCPGVLRVSREAFHAAAAPRFTAADVHEAVERDVHRLRLGPHSPRVLLSFLGDPYQPAEEDLRHTRMALMILADYGVPFGVLTKAGDLPRRDFDLLAFHDGWLGVSASWWDDCLREPWEPGAGSIGERYVLMRDAARDGIRTWLSVEPVVDPAEALRCINAFGIHADEIRVGALTKHQHAAHVDWERFAAEVYEALQHVGCDYLIKQSLAQYLPADAVLRKGEAA